MVWERLGASKAYARGLIGTVGHWRLPGITRIAHLAIVLLRAVRRRHYPLERRLVVNVSGERSLMRVVLHPILLFSEVMIISHLRVILLGLLIVPETLNIASLRT